MWVKRVFEWVEDDRGVAGWRPEGFSRLDSEQGFGVAHDAMEHFTFGDSLDNEGYALGAILWGREGGGWDEWRRSNSHFGKILACDLADFITEHGSVPPTDRGVTPLSEAWAEDQLDLLARESLEAMESGFAEDRRYDMSRARVDVQMMVRYTRLGFRLAARRIGRHMCPEDWLYMFDTVANHRLCGGYTSATAYVPASENDKLIVSFSLAQRRVQVRLDGYVDPYM